MVLHGNATKSEPCFSSSKFLISWKKKAPESKENRRTWKNRGSGPRERLQLGHRLGEAILCRVGSILLRAYFELRLIWGEQEKSVSILFHLISSFGH